MDINNLTLLQKKRIELEVLETIVDRINYEIKMMGTTWDFQTHEYVKDPEYQENAEDMYKKWYLKMIKEDLEAKI